MGICGDGGGGTHRLPSIVPNARGLTVYTKELFWEEREFVRTDAGYGFGFLLAVQLRLELHMGRVRHACETFQDLSSRHSRISRSLPLQRRARKKALAVHHFPTAVGLPSRVVSPEASSCFLLARGGARGVC